MALGSDEGEHLVLVAVLAHERGREAEAPARLQVGRDAEDRGGQEMHLVMDDEAPVMRVEEGEVRKGPLLVLAPRQDLVRRDGDGLDVLAIARVLADLILRERGLVEDLADPLMRRRDVRDQDEAVLLHHREDGESHHGLACAAGQHDDAVTAGGRAALVEDLGRLALVGPKAEREPCERRAAKRELERRALAEADEIVGGEAHAHESALEHASSAQRHLVLAGTGGHAEMLDDATIGARLPGEHVVVEHHSQHVGSVGWQEADPAMPGHRFADLDGDVLGKRVLAELDERGDDAVGLKSGRRRVPERER
jgi:hypothetical protein